MDNRLPANSWQRRSSACARVARRSLRVLFVLTFLFCLVVGFGTSTADLSRLQAFVSSVDGWQQDPEFRQVTQQYVDRGSSAMASRPMGMRSAGWIMWFRSLPGLPSGFSVNDTSRDHYENFSKGPLSAYLHLCTEIHLTAADGSAGYLAEFEKKLGTLPPPDDQALRAWLHGLKWDYPVCADNGAVQSLRTLIEDVQFSHPLTVRSPHINPFLHPHIAAIARGLSLPTNDVSQMTTDQQEAVFERLDAHVRRHDPELWRTKQVSDFIGGIWGQVFSPPYLTLLGPYLTLVTISRWIVLGQLVFLIWYARTIRAVRNADPTAGRVSAI